jgi:hypothetical protein
MESYVIKGNASHVLNHALAFHEEARLNLNTNGLELLLKMGHEIFGTRVCPDDCPAERSTCLAIPSDTGLALICDT